MRRVVFEAVTWPRAGCARTWPRVPTAVGAGVLPFAHARTHPDNVAMCFGAHPSRRPAPSDPAAGGRRPRTGDSSSESPDARRSTSPMHSAQNACAHLRIHLRLFHVGWVWLGLVVGMQSAQKASAHPRIYVGRFRCWVLSSGCRRVLRPRQCTRCRKLEEICILCGTFSCSGRYAMQMWVRDRVGCIGVAIVCAARPHRSFRRVRAPVLVVASVVDAARPASAAGVVAGVGGSIGWRESVWRPTQSEAPTAVLTVIWGGSRWRKSVAGVDGGSRWRESVAGVSGGSRWRESRMICARASRSPPRREHGAARLQRVDVGVGGRDQVIGIALDSRSRAVCGSPWRESVRFPYQHSAHTRTRTYCTQWANTSA